MHACPVFFFSLCFFFLISLGRRTKQTKKRWAEVTEHRSNLRNKWTARLQWVPEDVDVWRSILAVRSLVLKPREVSWGEGGP